MAQNSTTNIAATTNKFALTTYGGGRGSTALTRRDIFRRFLGEHSGGTDPMITGFGVVFFTKLPAPLESSERANWLTAMTNSFDLPDMTIESIDYEGRDGGQWHVPGAAKVNNEVTLNMWEMAGVPTYTILSQWYQLMRNPHYGFMSETTWYHSNYKGQIMYAACTPDLHVQIAKVYNGVWPKDLKDSAFKYDNNQEKVEFSCTFSFDHYPYSSSAINDIAEANVKAMWGDVNTAVTNQFKVAEAAKIASSS